MTKRKTNFWVGAAAAAWMIGLTVSATAFRFQRSQQERQDQVQLAQLTQVPEESQKSTEVKRCPEPARPEKRDLFDGKSLQGWKVLTEDTFEDHGKVTVEKGVIRLEKGTPATGIRWTKKFPRTNYEVSLQARRVDGSDFFCGLTFPIGKAYCTLIVGGWGGSVVGLSNVDHMNASENATTNGMSFKDEQWYTIKLRVTGKAVKVWIDDDEMIDQNVPEHEFDIWWEQEPARPFGVATWYTGAELQNIVLRELKVREQGAEADK